MKLEPCCGSEGWYVVLREVELPGEWVFERVGPRESRGPFQKPARTVWLSAGFVRKP